MRLANLAFLLIPVAVLATENPYLGTWKMNTAKSKSTPTPVPKEMTVTFEEDGDKVRRTVSGIDGEGKPMKQGGSIAWDGKEHQVESPDGNVMLISVKRVHDRQNDVTVKQNGKVITQVRSVISKDGTTMTNTIDGVNAKGEKFHVVEVLEKQ